DQRRRHHDVAAAALRRLLGSGAKRPRGRPQVEEGAPLRQLPEFELEALPEHAVRAPDAAALEALAQRLAEDLDDAGEVLAGAALDGRGVHRSEEHTSEL